MSKVIYKYAIDGVGFTTQHEMPKGAEFLYVDLQNDTPQAWFLIDPSVDRTTFRLFKVYGTGHKIPMRERYLGTYQQPPYVWHLFEELQS
jgi:hypothetical protein